MPFLTTRAVPATRIYYEDIGEGPPVVLVHGWPLSHRMWEPQVDALTEAGYRCIAYDRRGFGASDSPGDGYDYDTLAGDLHDLVTTLDLHDATLAGFSMGGGEVARYFGRFGAEDRVSRAMLIATVTPFLLRTDDNPEGLDAQVFDAMVSGIRADRIGFLDGFVRKFFNLDRNPGAVGDDALLYAKTIAWYASPLATRRCVDAFGRTDFRQDLKRITVPTLVVHGDSDQIVPFEVSGRKSAGMIEHSRLDLIEGAPHGLNLTHADQLNELMTGFLRG